MTTLVLDQYINFDSVQELNHHVSQHVDNNSLSDNQYKLLTVLSRYSVKYPGASYLKVSTIMKIMDVSRSTIKRGLNTLTALGIISKVSTKRKKMGGFGANIYVINAFFNNNEPSEMNRRIEPETLTDSKDGGHSEEIKTTSVKAQLLNSLVTEQSAINRKENINYKDVVPSHIPTKLGEHMIKFFDSGTVNRLYSSLKNALKVYIKRYDNETIQDYMYRGFNALISAIKKYNNNPYKYPEVRNIYGYAFHSTLSIAVKEEFMSDCLH